MTWIKDIKGDIINTRHIQSIVYHESINGSEVLCTLELAGQILQATTFKGTEEECKEYMDKLMRDLNGGPYIVPAQNISELASLYNASDPGSVIMPLCEEEK